MYKLNESMALQKVYEVRTKSESIDNLRIYSISISNNIKYYLLCEISV